MTGCAAGSLIRLDHASKLGYLLGTSERAVQAVLAQELSAGQVFYDLGANIGFLTIVGARLVGPKGHVTAFEPCPENAATLRSNVSVNGLSWVDVVEAAVGKESGTEWFVAGHTDQTGHVGEATDSGKPVTAFSIDDWLSSGRRPPDLVKIDVEGAERDVLDGARHLLSQHRPTVICEVHAVGPCLADHEVSLLLRQLGYSTSWLDPAVETDPRSWAPHLIARPQE